MTDSVEPDLIDIPDSTESTELIELTEPTTGNPHADRVAAWLEADAEDRLAQSPAGRVKRNPLDLIVGGRGVPDGRILVSALQVGQRLPQFNARANKDVTRATDELNARGKPRKYALHDPPDQVVIDIKPDPVVPRLVAIKVRDVLTQKVSTVYAYETDLVPWAGTRGLSRSNVIISMTPTVDWTDVEHWLQTPLASSLSLTDRLPPAAGWPEGYVPPVARAQIMRILKAKEDAIDAIADEMAPGWEEKINELDLELERTRAALPDLNFGSDKLLAEAVYHGTMRVTAIIPLEHDPDQLEIRTVDECDKRCTRMFRFRKTEKVIFPRVLVRGRRTPEFSRNDQKYLDDYVYVGKRGRCFRFLRHPTGRGRWPKIFPEINEWEPALFGPKMEIPLSSTRPPRRGLVWPPRLLTTSQIDDLVRLGANREALEAEVEEAFSTLTYFEIEWRNKMLAVSPTSLEGARPLLQSADEAYEYMISGTKSKRS